MLSEEAKLQRRPRFARSVPAAYHDRRRRAAVLTVPPTPTPVPVNACARRVHPRSPADRSAIEPYEPIPIDSTDMSDEGSHKLDDEEDAMDRHPPARDPGVSSGSWRASPCIAVTAAAAFAARQRISPAAAPPVTTGKMTVNTDPPGAEVEVDGDNPRATHLSASPWRPARTRLWCGRMGVAHDSDHHRRRRDSLPVPRAAESRVGLRSAAGSHRARRRAHQHRRHARRKDADDIVELAPGEHTVTLESDLGT